ncbi:MAG: DUF2155 domain-containing protein [Paracoccaceae bacterium]
MKIITLSLYFVCSSLLLAQTSDFTLDLNITTESIEIIEDFRVKTSNSNTAFLRGLDKMAGKSSDLEININNDVIFGSLKIKLNECRYPSNNPTGDGFAHLKIDNLLTNNREFQGWMVASSPALMSLDNPRYDIWLIKCKTLKDPPQTAARKNLRRPPMRSSINLDN